MQRRLRLRRAEDFKRLREIGYTRRHPALMLSYTANSLDSNRYGFITAKRLGHAVQRNRVRRLLREAVRAVHPHLATSYDIVFIARHGIVEQPLVEIQRIVVQLCDQAGLLSEEFQS
mgnify:CR=1 FL=1